MKYRRREADARIARALGVMGGVVLEGPRACGKTSTGSHHARSAVRLDESRSVAELAELDPTGLLEGETPRLIDEWQLTPSLWNVIRHEVDRRQAPGQFILSGSATPTDDVRRHSGAGRFARIRMRPMSIHERGRSTAAVSLAALGDEPLTGVRSDLTYQDLAVEAVRGGWPALIDASASDAREFTASYLQDLMATDLRLATGVRHDPVRVGRLLASLARTIGTEVTTASLAADVAADGAAVDRDTVRRYLDALTRVFVVDEQPAWAVSLRSRTRLRQQPKMHLADPSLACAALRLTPARLAGDPEYFGQVFESMAVADLRASIESWGGQVHHYRDSTGLEVDAILELDDGGWAACEVKLGASRVEAAEAALLRLRERVDVGRTGRPRFLAVITGTEHGYTLPSGVHVLPLGALAP
ncbi:ATP-binding protein [Litorihabitans aurantiacus]|uniref:ATP-binding protein n=1 Tax=Litorihabitans aurantiacus TaxID=1930061 RepID=UPI0024E0690C|nr:DUF4143 domain-containing protein [Litorihabitans aurantiacus]